MPAPHTHLLKNPKEYMLNNKTLNHFKDYTKSRYKSAEDRYAPFKKWIKSNDDIAQYKGDHYGIWMGIVTDLINKCGHKYLEKCIRAMRVDEAFYRKIYPEVNKVIQNLPDEDIKGWKLNPANNHYYCRTPVAMTWYQAEQFAQSLGGHLVNINNSDELNWLSGRFKKYAELWIGVLWSY